MLYARLQCSASAPPPPPPPPPHTQKKTSVLCKTAIFSPPPPPSSAIQKTEQRTESLGFIVCIGIIYSHMHHLKCTCSSKQECFKSLCCSTCCGRGLISLWAIVNCGLIWPHKVSQCNQLWLAALTYQNLSHSFLS